MAIYFEKPEKKIADACIKLKCKDEQTVWISFDEWLRPKEIRSMRNKIPAEIKNMIPKWREDVNKLKETFVHKWYTKLASVEFIYEGKFYKLMPEAIGATQEMYDYVSRTIEDDLKEMGAIYTFYTGMLD